MNSESDSAVSFLKVVGRVGSNQAVGRIYVNKSLIGKVVRITPLADGLSPRAFIEAVFGAAITGILFPNPVEHK